MSLSNEVKQDLRSWIAAMASAGQLQEVHGAEREEEIGGIVDVYQRKIGNKALLFDDIPGYPKGYRILANILTSVPRINMTIGLPANTREIDLVAFVQSVEERKKAFAGYAKGPVDAVRDMSLAENAFLSGHRRKRLMRRGLIDGRRTRTFADEVIRGFDVRTNGPEARARSLSGGNLQKFIVGREILQQPGVLAVAQPTWGVDAAASAAIQQALLDLAAAGAAVVVISQDLDEIFSLCDRVAVLRGGSVGFVGDVTKLKSEFGVDESSTDGQSSFEGSLEPFYAGAHQ